MSLRNAFLDGTKCVLLDEDCFTQTADHRFEPFYGDCRFCSFPLLAKGRTWNEIGKMKRKKE